MVFKMGQQETVTDIKVILAEYKRTESEFLFYFDIFCVVQIFTNSWRTGNWLKREKRIWGWRFPYCVRCTRFLHTSKFTIRVALCDRGIIMPIFLQETINFCRYTTLMHEFLSCCTLCPRSSLTTLNKGRYFE